MSLLRRREMMEGREQEENVIYVDSGFLEMDTSTAFSDPTYNGRYPDASSTTVFDVSNGDVVHLDASTVRSNQRIRIYKEDGSYLTMMSVYNDNAQIMYTEAKYARVLLIAAGDVENLSVTRAEDNETVNYKIIDRR